MNYFGWLHYNNVGAVFHRKSQQSQYFDIDMEGRLRFFGIRQMGRDEAREAAHIYAYFAEHGTLVGVEDAWEDRPTEKEFVQAHHTEDHTEEEATAK